MHYSESEIRRVAHVGFQIAVKRAKKMCSVDKANVLDTSMFWREIVTEVAREYPQVEFIAHVRGQCCDATGAGAQAVRRDPDRKYFR